MNTNQACGLLLLIALSICQPCAAQSQRVGFWAKGFASSTLFDANGGLIGNRHTVLFTAEVAGSAWCLTIVNRENQSDIFACDGTNLINVFYDSTSRTNLIPATVDPAGPPLEGGYADFLWLALCSSHYLESGGRLTAPWTSARNDVRAHMYDAKTEGLSTLTHLPAHIEFFSNPSSRKYALQSELLRYEGIPERDLFDRKVKSALVTRRYHAADYDVISITNVYEQSFPSRFRLTNYRDLDVARASLKYTNRVVAIYEGAVEKAGPLFERPGWPPLHGVAGVVDRRFRSRRQGIEFIRYFVTNTWRIDINDPWLQELFAAKKHTAPFVRLSITKGVILCCLFGLLALLPVIVWWRVRISARRTVQTQNTHVV